MADDFFDVPLSTHPTSAGPVQLPVLYRDASMFAVNWRVPMGPVNELLAGRSVEPWPLFGKAIVALYVWSYREGSLGPYNEVGLGILCRRRGTRPSLARLVLNADADDDQGIWVHNLPVTTDAALVAGIELWGYPKYVTPITTEFADDHTGVRLGDELSLTIGAPGWFTTKARTLVCYTVSTANRLLRTPIVMDYRVRWGGGAAARLELLGPGPTADTARALGLADRRPLAVFRTGGFRARLPAGKDLGSGSA